MGHRPRKRFGQNFLVDKNIIRKIIQVINPQPGQHIIEIGPGLGALTQHILPLTHAIDVIEIDKNIIPLLKEKCQNLGKMTLHNIDVLTVNFNQLQHHNESLRIIGNLPYNISTPLLFHLLHYLNIIQDMHFMLQKEVVARICAAPGNKTYGRLSVMIQYHCQAEHLFNVASNAFSPRPKVASAIVRLQPRRQLPLTAKKYEQFAAIVKQAFSQRRKTLQNSLKKWGPATVWQQVSIDPQCRPEQLSVKDFIILTQQLMT